MSIASELFSWWGGKTWGTRLWLWRFSEVVGRDDFGNTYHQQKKGVGPLGVPRRWVTYTDLADASKVPPEWHGWLHYTVDTPPAKGYRPKPWQKAHRMYGGQIFFFPISSAIYSACRMARDTIVKVGFSAPPVVNWLPSEMNRFLTS